MWEANESAESVRAWEGVSLRRLLIVALFVFPVVLSGFAQGAPGGVAADRLQMYVATVTQEETSQLQADGYDIVDQRQTSTGAIEIALVLTKDQVRAIKSMGIQLRLWRNADGFTATQLAARQEEGGYRVWRSWDEEGGIEDEMYRLARRHDFVELHDIGNTHKGRDILALEVTRNADNRPGGTRPAVLYSSAQHAREWISVEVNRRILHYFVDNYGQKPRPTRLVNTRELWFVLVANPDGYEYSFDVDRLWRKNLREINGEPGTQSGDGVDPNRNFDEHWRYDEEGSSSDPSSETYRGPSAASEPETQAMQGLLQSVGLNPEGNRFAFQINYHSYGELLLYSFGWQVQTVSTDNPIFLALSGENPGNTAIPGFDPGPGADLYTTNGETTDYAHARAGTLAWTPELSEDQAGNGFVFPDNKGLVNDEFEHNLPFALDVAESADNPARPESHLDSEVAPFYPDAFSVSYGDPQTVQTSALRDLDGDGNVDQGEASDPVMLKYSINGGPTVTAPTVEWNGGERYGGPGDVYYRKVRGTVTGAGAGDQVSVWFTGGGKRSEPFTYTVEEDSNTEVLVLAAEDYTGLSPKTNGTAPKYVDYYVDAIEANGVDATVYDVDAHDRTEPHPLGVLSHFEAVTWYTGDDVITRDIGMKPGTADKLALDELLSVRDYLNEDGADLARDGGLLYTGKYAGLQYAQGYEYNPYDNNPCSTSTSSDLCVPLSDDFLQYYLGAYIYNDNAGSQANGQPYPVDGIDTPFEGLEWDFNGADSAKNQNHTASFLTTAGLLDPDFYSGPFDTESGEVGSNWASAEWDRGSGASPYEPRTGNYYMFSQRADVSYKRLMTTVNVPAGGSTMSFWTSYDTEPAWDFLFVEAHTVGQNDWTTLPDENGHTSPSVGDSCPEGWHELHPFLTHYQSESCQPSGTTGEWHAASGNSSGWQQWEVDLSQFAGKQIEISISYASDWAIQGLGVFVDDIAFSSGGGSTSFEGGMDGWRVPGSPEGSDRNPNDWIRATADEVGYEEGAAISTPETIYFGFGFEGITGQAKRNQVMGRVLDHLLP
jgi:hypothetical protein